MRRLWLPSVFLFASCLFVSPARANDVFLVAPLKGSQEIPLIKTSATGEVAFTLNTDNSLTCSLTTTDTKKALAAQLRFAPAGIAGGPRILTLPGGPTAWSCPLTALSVDKVNALRPGQMYVDVQTSDPPSNDGELRGQIVATPL